MSRRRPPRPGRGARVDDDLDGSDNDPPHRDLSGEESVSHSQDDLDPYDAASVDSQRVERPSRRHDRVQVEERPRSQTQPLEAAINTQRRPSRRTTIEVPIDGPSGAAKARKPPLRRDSEKLRSRFAPQPSPEPFSDADSYADDFGWGPPYGRGYPPPPPRASGAFYGHHGSHGLHGGHGYQMVPYNPSPLNPFAPPPEAMPYSTAMPTHYGGPSGIGGYYAHGPQQPYMFTPPPPPPTEHPTSVPRAEVAKSKLELEMEQMRAEMHAQSRAREEADRQRELEERIRRDTEETMQRRMEASRRAQEDVQKGLEKAKQEAEAAARKRMEEEQKAEEHRRKVFAEEMAKANAEERARAQAAIQAEEMAREKRKEDEVRMLREAKEKALAELEAERERARRDEAERSSLLEELRAQVRQEMATEAARIAGEIGSVSTHSRSEIGRRGGSGRRVPPRPPRPPPLKFPPPPSAQTDSGEEDEVIMEERERAIDVSDSSSVHSSDSSLSLKTWRRQKRKDDRAEMRILGKELAKPIVETLLSRLPVTGGSYMPPMPAFYMQYPPLPMVRDTRQQHSELQNDHTYSAYSSDETHDSDSDADTITPRRSRHPAKPERRIRSGARNRDKSIASRDSRGSGRRSRTWRAHSESDSDHKDVRGSKVTSTKRSSHDTDRISRALDVSTQDMRESGAAVISDLNPQATTADVNHTSANDQNSDLPLSSTEDERGLDAEVSVKYDQFGDAASHISDETEKGTQKAPDTHEQSHDVPGLFSTEGNPSEHDLSDTASATVKPPAGSRASRSPRPKAAYQIIDIDNTESDREDTATTTRRSKSHRTDSPKNTSSPREQRRLERREAKHTRTASRSRDEKQKQRHADRNELDMYSPFGPGAFPTTSSNQVDRQMLPVPFPYHYPQPYQFGIPRGSLSHGTYRRETRSRDDGRRRGGRAGRIPVAFMPQQQQPYGLFVMMAPPPPPPY